MYRRLFGWVDDAVVGGSPLDSLRAPGVLTEGAIPDATQMWPVQNVTVDKGLDPRERNDEVRNRRGNVAPLEFRANPSCTVRGRLYPPLLKKLLALATGGTPTVTGTSPAAITRKWAPVGAGASGLPAVHLSVVRDDLYEKLAGCQLSQLQLMFPLDGDATFEAQFAGLYRRPVTGSPPAADYSYLDDPEWVFTLRDAQAFLDASSSAIDGLRGYSLTFNNGLRDPGPWAKRNRLVVPATANDRERILWFPQERKLGPQAITGSIEFSDAKAVEDAKHDLSRAQKLVFEIDGPALATTPASRQVFRSTHFETVYTGGGASQLEREGDITSEYEFGSYVDEDSAGKDVEFELIEAS